MSCHFMSFEQLWRLSATTYPYRRLCCMCVCSRFNCTVFSIVLGVWWMLRARVSIVLAWMVDAAEMSFDLFLCRWWMLRACLSMLCVSSHLLLVPVVHVCLSIALAHMLDAAGWGLRGEGLREQLTRRCGNCVREHLTWLCESLHLLYMRAHVTKCWRERAAHIVFFLSTRRCFASRCICCYTTFWPQRLGQNMRYSKASETRNNEC